MTDPLAAALTGILIGFTVAYTVRRAWLDWRYLRYRNTRLRHRDRGATRQPSNAQWPPHRRGPR
jgi:hypothetical protein